jgi:alkaline phosphatase D
MARPVRDDASLPYQLDRRALLTGGLTLVGLGGSPRVIARARQDVAPGSPLFTLGVASGDPTPDGVVLWTRLAPDPIHGGGMQDGDVAVTWEVARDEGLTQIVQQGTAVASTALGHSVHVEVDGLEAGRWYWYRFRTASDVSRVGRTRTLPAVSSIAPRLRFAVASCQHFEQGYFTAYQHMLDEDLDLVLHLGDYIYEYEGRDGRPRKHTGDESELLSDYRNRHALYRTDPDLQAAHAHFPWVVTWDDHEVDNNYAASVSEDGLPAELFLRRRGVAYQAYYEHMPLRRRSMPNGPRMQLYRDFSWGELASFHVLDTRQYRTDQPCGDVRGPACGGVIDPAATLLGDTQERWLTNGLDRSTARWNVLPQQVMMARVDQRPGDDESFGMDVWSGYEVARRRLMEFLASRRPANPIVLTGDIHSNWVNDLKVDYRDAAAATVATEFVGTSISSGGDGSDTRETTAGMLSENPWVKFFNAQRGYIRCDVTPERYVADYRVLDVVTRPDGVMSTRASFVVEDGRPGAAAL